MKCYYHEEKDAVAQCTHCGVGLCRDCASQYSTPTCQGCADEITVVMLKDAKKRVRNAHIIFIVMLIMGIFLAVTEFTSGDIQEGFVQLIAGIISAYLFAGFPAGWRALNKITSSIFMFLPVIGWLIYFFVKGMLAFAVGIIAFPVEYFKARKTIRDLS